ncbi:MAG: type III secretion system chaperone [Lachnospiraceae bacterium]|nr:type III secretion system chaperone [Lachnospiraceae bacterium]
MQFFAVMDALARKCGLSGVEPRDSLSLLFDGQHDVTFQCNRSDRSVLMFTEICDVTDMRGSWAEMLLQASLLGAQTEGAAFAVSSRLGKVILWKRYDDAFEDESALEQAINTFLTAVITWKDRLAKQNADGASSGIPESGNLAV